MRGKWLVWLFAAALTVSLGWAAGVLIAGPGDSASHDRSLEDIPQTALAESSGVKVEALSAAFSGTETVVRLRITVVDDPPVAKAADGKEIASIVVARDGFDPAGWAGYSVDVLAFRDDEVLLRFPSFVPSSAYEGQAELHITALSLRLDRTAVRLDGSWNLGLVGPAPASLQGALRVESLGRQTTQIGGEDVVVSGYRSTSETRVTIELPAGVIVLGEPILTVADQRLSAFMSRPTDSAVILQFAPTPFGEAGTLDLGPVAIAGGEEEAYSVLVGSAFERAHGASEFDIAPEEVLQGSPQSVLSGQHGFYGSREWIGIRVVGNYHAPAGVLPDAYDADGRALDVAHVQVGYNKDLDGNVLPGVTDVAVFIPSEGLEQLTVLLGQKSPVAQGPHIVELRPGP